MEARGTLKEMADSLRHTGMSRYESAQWALDRYRRFRATLERTRQARTTNGAHAEMNGAHAATNGAHGETKGHRRHSERGGWPE